MSVKTHMIQLSTRGDAQMHDITDAVASAVIGSDLQNGTVTVFCPSTTSGVTTI